MIKNGTIAKDIQSIVHFRNFNTVLPMTVEERATAQGTDRKPLLHILAR